MQLQQMLEFHVPVIGESGDKTQYVEFIVKKHSAESNCNFLHTVKQSWTNVLKSKTSFDLGYV